MKNQYRSILLSLSLAIILPCSLQAQDTIVITKMVTTVGADALIDNIPTADSSRAQPVPNYLITLNDKKLEMLLAGSQDLVEQQAHTTYIHPDFYRADLITQKSKISVQFDKKDSTLYYIDWAKKNYRRFPIKVMLAMRGGIIRRTGGAAEKSSFFAGMAESDIIREKKALLDSFPELRVDAGPSQAGPVASGRRKRIAGFDCEEFILKRSMETTAFWCHFEERELVAALRKIAAIFNPASSAPNSIWHYRPEALPLRVQKYRMDSSGRAVFEVADVVRISRKEMDLKFFAVPAHFVALEDTQGME